MIQSRFDLRIPFYVLIGLSVSYVLSIVLLQLFCGMLAILWIVEKNFEKRKTIDFFVIGITVYGIIRLLSIIFSEYPAQSVSALYKEALFYLSVFSFSFYLSVLTNKQIRVIIFSFVAGAALNALVGIIKFNLGLVERAESFSSGYMVFSAYLLAATGITLISFELLKDRKNYFFLYSAAGLILAGIVTSLGRANVFAAVVVIVLWVILKKKIEIKKILIIVLATGLISYISFLSNPSVISQRIESPASLSDRDIIYKGALEIYSQHPLFGFGPRTFKEIFPYYNQFIDKGIGSWHNQVLQIYFESGVIALIAYLILIALIFWNGFKYLKKPKNGNSRIIILGSVLSVAGLFLSSFFSNFLDSPILSIEFAFLVSLMISQFIQNPAPSEIIS